MSDVVDRDELAQRATRAVRAHRPAAAVAGLQPLPGGISSMTFWATLNEAPQPEESVVVKVSPPGLPPVRNRDVLRQARILRALRDVPGVSVPHVLGEDEGSPPLFVMEFVEGQAYEPKWDVTADPPPPDPPPLEARVRAAAIMLAHMHEPDPAALGLDDEPPLSPGHELERWAELFATAGDDLRGHERHLYDALSAGLPEPAAPRVTHGDYRLGNLLFAGERAAAIIDWELWSVGDPRTDLAWLAMFCDPAIERAPAGAADGVAMPHPDTVVAAYEAVRPGAGAQLDWFLPYAHYKLAAAMSVLAKRNRRAACPDPTLERAAQTLPAAIARGLRLLT